MTTMQREDDRARERAREVSAAVADIREIERRAGTTQAALEEIKARLVGLARRADLFTLEDYPPPRPGAKRNSCLYRLSEDADHRFALYANSAHGGAYDTPAHNHTTWAVIVGVRGEELNRFYERADGGVRQTGEYVVRPGSGVAFMPDDLHSIHIRGPLINFHMYGLALEQLHRREYYHAAERAWRVFPPHTEIHEARVVPA